MTVKRVMFLTGAAVLLATIGAFERTAGANSAIQFTDVTAAAGIRFKHDNGAFGKKYLPETMGSGCAFLDVDGDGWQDILLVQSTSWPGRRRRQDAFRARALPEQPERHVHGRHAQRGSCGRDVRPGCRRGGLRQRRRCRHLSSRRSAPTGSFSNDGAGRFEDVTAQAGVGDPGFSASALWFDYDRDGRLDLFVANYVRWSIETDRFCSLDGKTKSYCTPEAYKGQSPTLYRNNGDGTFEDVTKKAGLLRPGEQDARPRADRLRQRRLARRVRRQRHAAQPVVSQQGRRHVRRRRLSRPASRSTKQAWRAPAWASMRRTTTARAARASSSAISRTR